MKEHLSYVQNVRGTGVWDDWRNIKYDVEKTNSLVSPYIAEVSAEVYEIIGENKTYTAADFRYDYDLSLIYQDKDWKLKGVKRQQYLHYNGKWEPYKDVETLYNDSGSWMMVELQLKLKR